MGLQMGENGRNSLTNSDPDANGTGTGRAVFVGPDGGGNGYRGSREELGCGRRSDQTGNSDWVDYVRSLDCKTKQCGEDCDPCAAKDACSKNDGPYACSYERQCRPVRD